MSTGDVYFDFSDSEKAVYDEICSFAKRMYIQELDAPISKFPPCFVFARDNSGKIIASLGLTSAQNQPVLLAERYFDKKILEERIGNYINNRSLLAEMGTFATERDYRNLAFYQKFMASFLSVASHYNIEAILLTAGRPVQRILRELGMPRHEIGDPDSSRLTKEEQILWEGFFKRSPRTYWFLVKDGLAHLESTLKMLRAAKQLL